LQKTETNTFTFGLKKEEKNKTKRYLH
jgi:hypothetical protein